MSEELVALANEYHRIQRQIEAKKQQLDALLAMNGEAGEFPVDFGGALNKRYVVELSFNTDPSSVRGALVNPPPQEGSVLVDHGTIFRCAYIESFVRAVGVAEDAHSAEDITVEATLPWNQRLRMFDYFWNVRDTGSDREWSDAMMPSLFGGGSYMNQLWLPRRLPLGGGTNIIVNVDPFYSLTDFTGASDTYFAGGSVSKYIVQIGFVGHEVPDTGAL